MSRREPPSTTAPVSGVRPTGADLAEARRGTVPPLVQQVLATPGQPLDAATRGWSEARLGHDFSAVRIHADGEAAASAEQLDARAYTFGRDVVFGPRAFEPQSRRGRALLAHELAHVVQQGSNPATLLPQTAIGAPGDAAEQAADVAMRIAMHDVPPRSAALALRQSLRSGAPAAPSLQRAIKTWAGEWDTDVYKANVVGGVSVGVEIDLRFKPGDPVNAESIALVQTANSIDTGKVFSLNATVGARSIPAGQSGEGTHIDQAEHNRNPLYAVEKAPAKDRSLASTGASKAFGQHGFHFTDKTGTLKEKDAKLHDETDLSGYGANSSQTYETTAVAIKGEQVGTYYGSVHWGWRSDGANKFQRLPLSKGSDDVPSLRFANAATLFNKTKTSTGEDPLTLSVAAGRFINDIDTAFVSDPADPAASEIGKLDKNTRVEFTDWGWGKGFNKGNKDKWRKVTAVDGVFIGSVGWVVNSRLSPKKS